MSMYLSVHLDVVDASHFTIGARRRRGGSRVSVSGQARDGGTRGVNQKHDKMKKIIRTKIPKDVKAFNLESGVIRNSIVDKESRILIWGDKTEVDNTSLKGYISILGDSVVKDCKISTDGGSIYESIIINCNISEEFDFDDCVVKDSILRNIKIIRNYCWINVEKGKDVIIPKDFENADIEIKDGSVNMSFSKSNNVWSLKKVKLSDFLRDYYKL